MSYEEETVETETMETAPADTSEETAATEVAPEPEDKIALLEKRIQDQEKFIGRMGQEKGAQAKLLQEMARKQAAQEQYIQSLRNPEPDHDAQIERIKAQIQSGEIDLADGTLAISEITAQRAGAEAFERAQAMLEEERKRMWMDNQNQKYIEAEPDYLDFLDRWNAGELEDIKALHPYIGGDPTLAHQKWKRMEAENALKAAQQSGKEKGLKEAEKLSVGTGDGKKILSGPGNTASQVKQPKTLKDAKANFLNRYDGTGKFTG